MRSSSYCYESLLIERLEREDRSINYKRAFDLGGIASDIEGSVKGQIDTSSPTAIAETVAKFLVPGVLFKISPVLGVLNTAASFVGLDIVSLFEKFIAFVKPKIMKGEAIDPSSITQMGKSLGAQLGGDDGSANDGKYSFHSLLNEVIKNGYGGRGYRGYGGSSPTIPFFGGGDSSWLGRVFGNLFKSQAKGKIRWLIVGFVTWLVKTVLLSAGLLAVGAAVKSLVMPGSQHTDQDVKHYSPHESTGTDSATKPVSLVTPIEVDESFKPSGRGEELHVNDSTTSIWVVPIVGGGVEDTLMAWIEDIYPDVTLPLNNPSFYRMVDKLRRANDYKSSKQMAIPTEFKSRKQIVDTILKGSK
jgi:hypothetical protein